MSSNYFDGDSVHLTDEQRSKVVEYYKSNHTADDFRSVCKALIASATTRDNKVSIALALAAIFSQEYEFPASGDQNLKAGLFLVDMQDELDAMSNDNESELDDAAFDEHWHTFETLVSKN